MYVLVFFFFFFFEQSYTSQSQALFVGQSSLYSVSTLPQPSRHWGFKSVQHTFRVGYNFQNYMSTIVSSADEFKGHSLLQAAREADLAKVKKTLALEIINFKQPQSHETALVR